MSIRYRLNNGTEIICAGLTPGGDIEAGAVATREGTITTASDIATDTNLQPQITFDTPLPDTDYDITLEAVANWPNESGALTVVPFHNTKTVNGFKIIIYHTTGKTVPAGMVVYWKATKTYTVQHDKQNTEAITAIQAAMPTNASAANKLVTKSYVDNEDNTIKNRIADIEDLIPNDASVTNQLVTESDIELDTLPTQSSTKGVQSGGVYTALNDKDTIPTLGSTKSVTSEGIYNSELEIWKNKGIVGAKNLIPFPYANTYPTTSRGITFDLNDDGSFSFSGTADNANVSTIVISGVKQKFYLPAGTYKLTGGTSAYGGAFLAFFDDEAQTIHYSGTYDGLYTSGDYIILTTTENGQVWSTTNSYGYEKTFTLGSGAYISIQVRSVNNTYIDPVSGTIYPMVRLANDLDSTYHKPALTNAQLTVDKASVDAAFTVCGVKNFVTARYTRTLKNGTFEAVINADDSVTLSGTPSGDSYVQYDLGDMPKRKYIMSGLTNECQNVDLRIYTYYQGASTGDVWQTTDVGDFVVDLRNKTFDAAYFYINRHTPNVECAGTVYPMLRLAEIEDDTYVKGALTNSQLTEKVKYETVTIPIDTYGGELVFRKSGKVVTMIGRLIGSSQNIPAKTSPVIAAIPAGYEPRCNVTAFGTVNSSIGSGILDVVTSSDPYPYSYIYVMGLDKAITRGRFSATYIIP